MTLATRSTVLVGGFALLFTLGCGDNAGGAAGSAGGGIGSDDGSSTPMHTFTLVNHCEQPIWLASNKESPTSNQDWALAPRCLDDRSCAAGQACEDHSCTCSSDDDCVLGATASTTAKCDMTTNKCAREATVTVAGGWSGRFWGRTHCSGADTAFVCKTGQCGASGGANIDCGSSGATANQATLFEITTAGVSGNDNFDVSLASGYNVPMIVTAELPADHGQWEASTSFDGGARIIETVGEDTFGYTQRSATGTSGATMPAFPGTWTDFVSDGAISWVNTGPVCQRSGCVTDLNTTCPPVLQILSGSGGAGGAGGAGMSEVIGCDAPANVCDPAASSCHADLDYYQCQNNGGREDLFSNKLVLQSPNAESYVCFSENDCPPGTQCLLNPTFESSFTMPTGTGVCTPVPQNGGCASTADDGKICPDRDYPFVDYHCETLTIDTAETFVCLPPTTTGLGDLWWNAANWTEVMPVVTCTEDSPCSTTHADNKCLAPVVKGGQKQCTEADVSCSCHAPVQCSTARGTNSGCPDPASCLNSTGQVDGAGATCTSEICYCGPQGVFSGACGPTNADWNSAAANVGDWARTFKAACPAAYSYQYDDPSSNWSCPNPSTDLNNYRIDFCFVPDPR